MIAGRRILKGTTPQYSAKAEIPGDEQSEWQNKAERSHDGLPPMMNFKGQ